MTLNIGETPILANFWRSISRLIIVMGQKDFARLTFSLGSRSTPNLKKIRDGPVSGSGHVSWNNPFSLQGPYEHLQKKKIIWAQALQKLCPAY